MVNIKISMATRIPSGPIKVEKTYEGKRTKQKKCYHYINLRDALQTGWTRVRDEDSEPIEEIVIEETYDIATEAELKKMNRDELVDWCLTYGVDLPNNSTTKRALETALALRARKIAEGVI